MAAVQFDKLHVGDGWKLSLAATVAAMSFVDSARAARRHYIEPEKDRARSRVQKAVVSALVSICQDKGVDLTHIGASVFHKRSRGWRRLPQLVRVLRFRLDDHPPPSPIVWTPGKGLIGYCWETNAPQHKNRAECKRQQSRAKPTKAAFSKWTPRKRSNFTHADWLNIIEKYGEIMAVPIPNTCGNIIGVLSIDIAKRAPLTKDVLGGTDAIVAATFAAKLLADDLHSLYDEA